MNGDFKKNSGPVEPEDDRELWDLLARAKQPEVSPYFARRVLRDAASLPQQSPSAALWRGLKAWWQAGLPLLRPPRAAAWSGAFAAVVICAASVMMTFSNDGAHLRLTSPAEQWGVSGGQQEMTAPQPEAAAETGAPADESVPLVDNGNTGGFPVVTMAAADDALTQQDAEVIADLDTLMAREETHLWTDDNSGF